MTCMKGAGVGTPNRRARHGKTTVPTQCRQGPFLPWLSDCEGIMGATLKTDLALVCAALLAGACVLGADLSVAEIVDMIARAL